VTINVDIFFRRFANFVLNISAVRANSKFQFVRVAVGKIHSHTVTAKLTSEKFRDAISLQNAWLLVIWFVSLKLFDKAFSIKILNVDKNNKCVY